MKRGEGQLFYVFLCSFFRYIFSVFSLEKTNDLLYPSIKPALGVVELHNFLGLKVYFHLK